MFGHYRLRDYDFKLIIMVLALSGIGVLAIGSAEEGLKTRQLAGVAVGFAIMIVISFLNYSYLLKLNWLMYAGNLALLALVVFMGTDRGGAQRWLVIGGLQFQPSETAKILLILFYAQFIMKHREKLNSFKMIALCIILIVIPWSLIFIQPDLSTSVVLMVIFAIVMYVGEISYKIIAGVLAIVIPVLAIMITLTLSPDSEMGFLRGFQNGRIMAFLHPEEYTSTLAYQQLNSVMAIGSGQLDGKGYMNNEITTVKNGNFISEAQTDFIFAVIGEEFGFKGAVVVILLLFAICVECLNVALRAKDLAGRIIAAGVGGLVAIQSFFNIGVATFLLPNTGLPLPFVSYGLTSLLSLYIGMGFVINVRLQGGRPGSAA